MIKKLGCNALEGCSFINLDAASANVDETGIQFWKQCI
jgi:hypothetical protein